MGYDLERGDGFPGVKKNDTPLPKTPTPEEKEWLDAEARDKVNQILCECSEYFPGGLIEDIGDPTTQLHILETELPAHINRVISEK